MIYLVADRLTYGLADSFTCFLTRLSTHSLAYYVTFQSASHLDRKHTLPLPLPLPLPLTRVPRTSMVSTLSSAASSAASTP